MSKQRTKNSKIVLLIGAMEGILVLFWLSSWLGGYITQDIFSVYSSVIVLMISTALFLTIKAADWLRYISALVLLLSISLGVLMLVSYNLSVNLQY